MDSFEEDMFLGRFATSRFADLSSSTNFATQGSGASHTDPDHLETDRLKTHYVKPVKPIIYKTVYKLDEDPLNWTIQERVVVEQLLKMEIPPGQGKLLVRSLLPLHDHNSVLEAVKRRKSSMDGAVIEDERR